MAMPKAVWLFLKCHNLPSCYWYMLPDCLLLLARIRRRLVLLFVIAGCIPAFCYLAEIGRASCRERVYISGVAGASKKRQKQRRAWRLHSRHADENGNSGRRA